MQPLSGKRKAYDRILRFLLYFCAALTCGLLIFIIGYIFVNPQAEKAKEIYLAVCGAGRAHGYVCAPSLFQKMIARCQGITSDVSVYERNRDTLVGALRGYGFSCVQPDGAFYLFVRAPGGDSDEFCERAKKYGLLIVPGGDFGAPEYARIAYCVSHDMIERSLPAFRELIAEYTERL